MLTATGGAGDLIFVTWMPETPSSSPAEAYEEITAKLEETSARLILERVYCSLESAPALLEARRPFAERIQSQPVAPTILEGTPCTGPGISGIHAIAFKSAAEADLEPVMADGKAIGWLARGREAEFLSLADVAQALPGRAALAPKEETSRALETAKQLLGAHGFAFQDVRRTWFYLHEILDWYNDFNRVRNDFFEAVGFSRSRDTIPASTGIWGHNLQGGACTLDLLAIRPIEGHAFEVRRLSHEAQNEATEYGSAFSRGLEVKLDDTRYVFVSGTASIDDHGNSVHDGDFTKQTDHTLEAVETLLAAAGANLGDLCQATSFIKLAEDVPTYDGLAKSKGLPGIPAVPMIADVCRDELLFELDAAAVLSKA